MRLLLVEDNPDIASLLEKLLVKAGYLVDVTYKLSHAKTAMIEGAYDAVILDRMLPDGDGIDLIRYCKSKKMNSRFLILSALNEIGQKVEGLDIGAQDYIAKPFEPEELLARLRVALRHSLPKTENIMIIGEISYNESTADILLREEPFMLPRREMLVLELLLKRFNRVVSREALEESVFGFDDEIASNSLESHISKLRKNLLNSKTKLAIHSIRGIGYILKEIA